MEELRGAIADLEDLLEELRRTPDATDESVERLDRVIGRITRWIWPLLDELDHENGYDD
jgi:hypothetical protein